MTPEQHRLFDALCHMQDLPLEDQLWLLAQATGRSDMINLPPRSSGAGTVSPSEKKAA